MYSSQTINLQNSAATPEKNVEPPRVLKSQVSLIQSSTIPDDDEKPEMEEADLVE